MNPLRRLARVLAFAAAFAFAAFALRAADPAPLRPDDEVIARAPSLGIEERRQLVYLYARLAKPKVATAIADLILAENPRDRQTLLVLASMHVEARDAAAVLRVARRFLEYYPGDHQGLYFLGAGYYLASNYADANRVLRDLKREQFSGRRYPYETDLAASAYAAGDWHRAMLSYQELLRHHRLGDELRDEVRRVLDGLYREHLPRLEASASSTRLEQARLWRYHAGNAQHLSDRHWLGVAFDRDAVELDAVPGLRAATADRAEASARLTTTYDRRWRTDVEVGAGREGVLASARVTVTLAKERNVSAEIAWNERAVDSLALEALDGRQARATLAVAWLVESDLVFSARLGTRDLRLASRRLGRGSGADFNLDHTLWRQGPHVVIGYRSAVARFTPVDPGALDAAAADPIADPAADAPSRRALLAGLVNRRIHRHGLGLQVDDTLADAWRYRLNLGSDYDFELGSLGWNAGLALVFLPRKSIELTVEAGYTSSAGASNAGSAASLLNLYLRLYH